MSQAQQQTQNKPRIASEEDNVIPNANISNPDNAWKAVGSPSRRGSTVAHFTEKKVSPNESPVADNVEPVVRRTSISENNPSGHWGSFGGFQWEGPSIFDEDGKPVSLPPTQPAPDDNVSLLHNTNYDVLSVPMLPSVSLEPIYRQHRSLSFSMGQEPTFFGYDDYDETPPPSASQYQSSFKTSLAPMEEEEDAYYGDEVDFNYIRSRSKSSGAAFGLLSQNQHSRLLNNGHIRRGSEQQDDLLINQRRRSSSRFFNLPNISEPTANPQLSLGDKERLDLLQRRLSQQQNQFQDYSFPEKPANNYNMMRRQSVTLNSQPPTNIQQLANQLENTHLRSDFPGLQQQQQQQQFQSQQPPPPQFRANDLYTQHLQQQPLFNNHYQQQPSFQPPHQQVADDYFDTDPKGIQDLGKGIPIHRLDPQVPLYMVEFKGGRTDFFYVLDSTKFRPQIGELVIVEGDRGKDLGKVAANTLTIDQVTTLEHKKQAQLQQIENKQTDEDVPAKAPKELHIKRIFRLASPDEINMLLVKGQDEHKALVVCQQKTKQRKLPMEVVDAEYQWDRRKLTFYFESETRIDFRELVRELFKTYKTRIWMCVVTAPITVEHIRALQDANKNLENTTTDISA